MFQLKTGMDFINETLRNPLTLQEAAPAAQASGKRTRGRPPKKQTKKAKSKITTTKKTEKQPVTKSKYLII